MSNLTLFSQIISKIDRPNFNKLVIDKQTDYCNKGFNSWSHMVSMLFCQFAKSQSLRDISNGLRSATGNLNHLGRYCLKKCVKFKLTDFCVEPKKHRKNELYTRTNVRNI